MLRFINTRQLVSHSLRLLNPDAGRTATSQGFAARRRAPTFLLAESADSRSIRWNLTVLRQAVEAMDFNIRPISKVCASTGEPLVAGTNCWSVLVEVDGKLTRQDYSDEAWTGPPENAIGHWRCEVPADAEANQQKIDPDSLFDYFMQLCEAPNVVEQDYQYVLALLLLRKRRLILEDSIEIDDLPAMRLIGSGGEGPFEVVERELSDDQIVELQNQLFGGSAQVAA